MMHGHLSVITPVNVVPEDVHTILAVKGFLLCSMMVLVGSDRGLLDARDTFRREEGLARGASVRELWPGTPGLRKGSAGVRSSSVVFRPPNRRLRRFEKKSG